MRHEITDIEAINHLLKLFYENLPKAGTINPYYDINKGLKTDLQHYQKLLTHFFTLLNYRNRKQHKNMYITSLQDIEASLKLLSIIELPKETLIKKDQGRYKYLQKYLGGRPTTRKEVEELLNLSKTQANTYLKQWLKENKIKKEGKQNKGYRYIFPRLDETAMLKELTQEDEIELSSYEEMMEEFNDFEGWENLQERT